MNTENKTKKHFLLDHPIIAAIVMIVIQQLLFIAVYGAAVPFIANPLALAAVGFISNAGIAFVMALLIKNSLKNGYILGFRGQNFVECLKLGWIFPVLLIVQALMGAFDFSAISQITVSGVITALFMAASAGFGEELMFRSIMANNMMRVWIEKKSGIYAAIFVSSAIFGLVHLTNAYASGMNLNVILQVGYAFALGALFCAMYLRTRNLWGCILMHTVFDFVPFLFSSGSSTVQKAAEILSGSIDLSDIILKSIVMVVGIALSLYLVRSAKHEEIKANFASAEPETEEAVSKKMAAQAA